MKFAIIVSEKDMAGMNIRQRLIDGFSAGEEGKFDGNPVFRMKTKNETRLYTIREDTVYLDNPSVDTDIMIYATRHQSKSGDKTLSVHAPGNFSEASFGGKEKMLCISPGSLMKTAFRILNEKGKGLGYDITLEATHHGPVLDKPVFFIEIGSAPEQWSELAPAEAIAKTLIETIDCEPKRFPAAIGFGGSHYCAAFNKIELEAETALAHICPKYSLEHIDEAMIRQMIDRSTDKVEMALLDWKGMNSENRAKLIPLLETIGLKIVRTKEI